MSIYLPRPPTGPQQPNRPGGGHVPGIPHMPVRGNASVHSIEQHESNVVGVGDNIYVVKEDFIYLDSATAKMTPQGTFLFNLKPSIQASGIERNYIYLKQFSALNTLNNINSSTFTVHRKVSGVETPYHRTFDIGAFNSVKDLCLALNEKFQPKDGGSTVPTSDKRDGGEAVPFVKFTYDETTCLVSAVQKDGYEIRLEGEVFDLLNLRINTISSWISMDTVDIWRAIANIYVSCNQIADAHTQTSVNIPNRLIKVQNRTNYGQYLQYEVELPIQPKELEPQMCNQLELRLYNEDGMTWFPERFLITLCRQVRKPVVKHQETYWVQDPSKTLLKADYESRKPPIKRFLPNDECPYHYTNYI